ncbi:MAG: rhomboid family intramembrane serine protease [Clostridiales bacterium]|nr:rhomboid family intramembrane serine protease [Clostridiales bacterium]
MYRNSLLDKLDRKIGRYALRNLMTIIVIGTAIVWLLDMVVFQRTGVLISNWLYFDKYAILEGQVWRVLTFVFVPEEYNMFYFALSLYFYWLIGNALENEWGSFRFDIFYLCGVLGAIGSGFITGYATNYYLNLSLFLAFAILYPDYRVLLFFFIPVKVKWLALVDVVLLAVTAIFVGWIERIALFVALFNIALFFWRIPFDKIRASHRRRKWKRETQRKDNDDPFDL